MNDVDREPIAAIAYVAALSDQKKSAEEEARLAELAKALGGPFTPSLAKAVLSGEADMDALIERLSSEDSRKKAYEFAAYVCMADGAANEQETAFLADLRKRLKIDQNAGREVDAPFQDVATVEDPGAAGPGKASPKAAPDRDFETAILRQAMLAGALELLPQSVAGVAIIPLQLRMVWGFARSAGHSLNIAQIKDLVATFGIGATSQLLEGAARRILSGISRTILGNALGGVVGGVGGAAASVATTFATTYALGHVARQYYAQGRMLSKSDLLTLFGRLREDATNIYPRVKAEIEGLSKTLSPARILEMVRGTNHHSAG